MFDPVTPRGRKGSGSHVLGVVHKLYNAKMAFFVTLPTSYNIISAHLTLLDRAIAVAFLTVCLSVRLSVKRVLCDKTK